MATLASAQAKWERKTAGAGDRWKRNTSGKGSDYGRGFSDFIGAPVRGDIISNWEQGVGAVGAADFEGSIRGKGSKWAESLRRSVT